MLVVSSEAKCANQWVCTSSTEMGSKDLKSTLQGKSKVTWALPGSRAACWGRLFILARSLVEGQQACEAPKLLVGGHKCTSFLLASLPMGVSAQQSDAGAHSPLAPSIPRKVLLHQAELQESCSHLHCILTVRGVIIFTKNRHIWVFYFFLITSRCCTLIIYFKRSLLSVVSKYTK